MYDDFQPDDDETLKRLPPVPTGNNGHEPEPTVKISPAPVAPTPVDYHRVTVPPPPPPPSTRGDSAARERMRRRRVHPRSGSSDWAWVVIALAMIAVVIVVSMSLTFLLRSTQEVQAVVPTAVVALPTPVDGRVEFTNTGFADGQEITLTDGRSIVLEPWDGESRFTVLLMGLDRRPGETGLAYRTDTMLLLSIDPETNSVGLLSIPRDLYVEVPGYGQLQRVNSPMVLGELQQPGYGPQLAMQTVQYNLGIRVHDYVAVDFRAVITVIDLIGGIDVNVEHAINDPQYPNMWYGYDPLYIPAGPQHLNGDMALKFARTRHSTSDFDRAQRQQQVLFAVRDRILDLDMLPGLITQAPSVLSNLDENVYTGLTLDQMIQLAWYLKDIPQENIHTGVITPDYVMGYMTPQGASVLIPNRTRLGDLMVQVFGTNYSE